MPPKRMTANPLKPLRYRPGKPSGPEQHSSSEEESDDSAGDDGVAQQPQPGQKLPQRAPPPKATSFANVDLDARRRQLEAEERARRKEEARERDRMEREAGFVTESEDDEDDSDSAQDDEDRDKQGQRTAPVKSAAQPVQRPTHSESGSDSGSEESSSGEEDDSSSSEDDRPKLLRPTFIRKDQRKPTAVAADPYAEAEALAARDRQRKQDEADALVRERIEAQAAARAAGRKGWDDDAGEEDEIPDDTDGVDKELEHTQWVARELSRLKRARAALEEREAEIAEVERRRELTSAEREKEDREYVEAQQDKKKERGGMASVLQKYHHKGAFFADDAKELGLLDRDVMGARFEDQVMGGGGGTAGVPEYLQVRDATMIGRKGRTRYKDMKTEDTGRWGDGFDNRRGGGGGRRDERGGYADVQDERFRPDFGRDRDGPGATGANASAVGQKRAGFGPHGDREGKRPKMADER